MGVWGRSTGEWGQENGGLGDGAHSLLKRRMVRFADRGGGPLSVSSIFFGILLQGIGEKVWERVFFLVGKGIRLRVSGRAD